MSKMSNFVDKLAKFIVKRRVYFIAGFLLLLIVCGCLIPQVKINYNLTEYLPKDSEITKSFEISGEEFGRSEVIMVMLKDVQEKDRASVVKSVADIENILSATENEYNGDKKAILLDVAFKEGLSYDKIRACIDSIRGLDKGACFTGMVMNDLFVQDTTDKETTKILLFLIPIILLVLIFTSKSWLDPLICVGVMGIAIVISMGTNIVFTGGVSFITQSILAALTMAISMDYSIFLLHAFRDELDKGETPKDAVVTALKKSFTTITIGSLTTVAGFFAMLFMRFALGFDMGMVFAKTIVIALLTVLLLMPGILLLLHKPIQKTTHRSFFPSFRPIGKFAVKSRWVSGALALVILVPAIIGQFNNNFVYGFSGMTEADGAQIAVEKNAIKENFDIGNQLIIMFPTGGDLEKELTMMTSLKALNKAGGALDTEDATPEKEDDKPLLMAKSRSYASLVNDIYGGVKMYAQMSGIEFKYTLSEFEKMLHDDDSLVMRMLISAAQTPSPFQPYAAQMLAGVRQLVGSKSMFYGNNYGRVILELDMAEEGESSFALIEKLKGIANASYADNNYFYGLSEVAYDIKEVVQVDYIVVTLISVVAIFLLILISFRKLSIPIILMFVIELGIFINMAIPYFMGTPLSFIAYLIISSVQLGCTIDYAILMISKYKAYREEFEPKKAAIESLNSGAASIFTSGGILTIVGVLINVISSNQLIAETGSMLWRAGLLSMFFVFFLLPGLFVIFDRFIIKRDKNKLAPALADSPALENANSDVIIQSNQIETLQADTQAENRADTQADTQTETQENIEPTNKADK